MSPLGFSHLEAIIACAMMMVACVISLVALFLQWWHRLSARVVAWVPGWCAAHSIFRMVGWSVRRLLLNLFVSGRHRPDASSSHSVYLNFIKLCFYYGYYFVSI